MIGRAGDDDGIKRRVLWPAFVTVARLDMHILVTETLQRRLRRLRERLDDLDRINFRDELGQDRCLIT